MPDHSIHFGGGGGVEAAQDEAGTEGALLQLLG